MAQCSAIGVNVLLLHPHVARSVFAKNFPWELVDPVVADPVRQDNDKKTIYKYIRKSLLMYTEGGDKTSQYSYLVVILSNWVPDNLVHRLPILPRHSDRGVAR